MKTNITILRQSLAIFSFLAIATSCSKDLAVETPAVEDLREPITFNVTNDTATRGAIATSISEFYVYAYETENTSNVVINNAHFTKNEAGVWSTDAMFYWSGNEITFCAYVPSDNFTQSGTTLKFSMDADVEDQEDLMVAKDVKSTGSVSFSFARIMSLVKFSVKGEDEDAYVVESVEISGVADAASFDMITGEWGPVSTSGTSYAADVVDSGSEGQITTSTGYLMVLPQTSDITITAENSNGTPKEYELKAVEWVAGNLYNYTIDRDGIEPEVVVPDNPDQDPTRGMFDLDEYSDDTDGLADFIADVAIACANDVTYYTIVGSHSYDDYIFSADGAFEYITTPNVVIDISGTELESWESTSWGTTNPERYRLPSSAFRDAANVSKVILHDGFEGIMGYAFRGCTSLTEVTPLDGIKFIDTYCFYDCQSLTSLSLPGIDYLPGSFAYNCDNLTTLKLTNSEEFNSSFASLCFSGFATENCVLYLHINHKDDVTKNSDGTYYNADWRSETWKEVKFVDDDGNEVDPFAGLSVVIDLDNDLNEYDFSVRYTALESLIEEYDAAGVTNYKIIGDYDNISASHIYGSNRPSTSNPFDEFTTPDVKLDFSEMTGAQNSYSTGGEYMYSWFQQYTGATQCKNIIEIIAPNEATVTTGGFALSCTDLQTVIFPNVYSIAGYTFEGCTNLTTLKLLTSNTSLSSSNWVNANAFRLNSSDTTSKLASNVTLYLHENQKSYVVKNSGSYVGATWKSYTWKEVKFVDDDGNEVE